MSKTDPSSLGAAIAAHLARVEKPVPLSTLGTSLRKAGVKIRNDQLPPLLAKLVHEGRAFEHPITRQGRNASPCYWNRSATEYVEESIRNAIGKDGEWTEMQLRKPLPKAYHGLADEVIGRLLAAGELFQGPPKGKSRLLRTTPADAFVESTIHKTIAGGGEWTEAQLRRPLPKAYHGFADEVIGRLLAAGKLFEGPPKGKSRRLRTEPARPTEALSAAQVKSLRGALKSVNALRRPALRLEDLLGFLDGSPAGRDRESTPIIQPTEDLILGFYREDLPRREGLRSMPIPWTWRRYEAHCRERGGRPDVKRFHALLRELAVAGRVALTVHDLPSELPTAEREILGSEPDGRVVYYWTPLT